MNLRERIEELGYYVQSCGPEILEVYLHGDYILRLTRYDRRSQWVDSHGFNISLYNVETRLDDIREVRGL